MMEMKMMKAMEVVKELDATNSDSFPTYMMKKHEYLKYNNQR